MLTIVTPNNSATITSSFEKRRRAMRSLEPERLALWQVDLFLG